MGGGQGDWDPLMLTNDFVKPYKRIWKMKEEEKRIRKLFFEVVFS